MQIEKAYSGFYLKEIVMFALSVAIYVCDIIAMCMTLTFRMGEGQM